MYKVLISGASWFIGKSLIKSLYSVNQNIWIWNLWRTEVSWTQFINIDTDDLDLFQFDVIVHALALSSDKYCEDFWQADDINIGITKKLIKFCESKPNCRLVFLSSVVLYDNSNIPPISENDTLNYFYNNYSFTKGVAEEYVRYKSTKGLKSTIIRLSNIYGPGQLFKNTPFLIPEKIVQWLMENKVVVRNADTMRDWLYIDDAIDAIAKIVFDQDFTGTFNLGSGVWTSAWDIGKIISSVLEVPYINLGLKATGPQNFYSDNSLIRDRLWWLPVTDIRTWLTQTIKYIREHLWTLQ